MSTLGRGFCLLVALASCRASRAAEIDLAALAERAAVRHPDVPRKVLAFYYPWYANAAVPGGSGSGMSWEGLDDQRKQIANVAHFPALGPYDSHDPKLIAQHCAWAKQAGVDGLIVSWWGRGSPTDWAMKPILDACQKAGLEVTIYYETVPRPQSAASAAKDLLYVLERYADHPAWLCVGKQPVLFIYGRTLGEIGIPAWAAAMAEVHRQYPRKAVFIGDEPSPRAARVFDGIHTYNTVGSLSGKSAPEARAWAKTAYPAWVRTADAQTRISTLTVIPGYDDTKIRKPGLRAERLDGALYQVQWEEAIAADPHWVLVTSWNEWYEGSEIEPSLEFAQKYLDMTAEYARRFKAKPRAPRAKPVPGKSGSAAADSAQKFPKVATAILPEPESPALWSLVRLPVQPKLLTWEQVAGLTSESARQLPILFCLGEERYRSTATRSGDVDAGLVAYLRGGGLLAVFPTGPMPFHYDETGKAVGHSAKFGLPLSVAGSDGGWERPPEGVRLRFVQLGDRLPGLPREFPFPTDVDPRWRPLVRSRLGADDVVVPLLELRDDKGMHYGDGAAFVVHKSSEPKGGKLLYVWFGLLQSAHGEALLNDLMGFLAAQVAER